MLLVPERKARRLAVYRRTDRRAPRVRASRSPAPARASRCVLRVGEVGHGTTRASRRRTPFPSGKNLSRAGSCRISSSRMLVIVHLPTCQRCVVIGSLHLARRLTDPRRRHYRSRWAPQPPTARACASRRRTTCPSSSRCCATMPVSARRASARTTRRTRSRRTATFAEISRDPQHEILVLGSTARSQACCSSRSCATSRARGGRRAQIEGVRIDSARRGGGLGRVLIGDALRRARERSCHLVQLTTDRRRPDALAFYERLVSSTRTTG